MKVESLRPYQKKVNLTVKVLKVNEPREVTSKLDDSKHTVTEALVGDDTATVLLTLWDDDIAKVSTEKTYDVINGFTSLFKNSIRLNVGRYGELKDGSADITEVNESNNLSGETGEEKAEPAAAAVVEETEEKEETEEETAEAEPDEEEKEETAKKGKKEEAAEEETTEDEPEEEETTEDEPEEEETASEETTEKKKK